MNPNMILTDFDQGTDEWFNARLGVATASRFSDALAFSEDKYRVMRSTGTCVRVFQALAEAEEAAAANDSYTIQHEPGKSLKARDDYLIELANERTTEVEDADDRFENFWMRRGKELEPYARQWYEIVTGSDVTEAGLAYYDERKAFGASVDGLVGDDGQLEIKCLKRINHTAIVLADEVPEDYIPQVQGQLFVTGRKWCDFVAYHPEAPVIGFIKRVYPDAEYQAKLKEGLERFERDLQAMVAKLTEMREAA